MLGKALAFAKEMISDYFFSGYIGLERRDLFFTEFPINQHGWIGISGHSHNR